MAPPKVLIIGAGISGLTLAQLLRKQNIPYEIFERDASPTARGPGYALGLYDLDATLPAEIWPDDLPPFQTTCHLLPLPLPSQINIFLQTGQVLTVEDTPETPCLRANRAKLRELLLTHLTINWNKRATKIIESPASDGGGGGGVTVCFEDGTTATGDVLVAADGKYSSVRPHVLGKPNDQVLERFPAGVIFGEVKLEGKELERQLELGHSVVVAVGDADEKFQVFQGVNKVNVDPETGKVVSGDYYWMLTKFDEELLDICYGHHHRDSESESEKRGGGGGGKKHWSMVEGPEERLKRAKAMVKTFKNEDLRVVVERTEVSGMKSNGWDTWWDAYITPEDVPTVNRVVLVGDAAHPLTPVRGDGAIHAIRDAVALSKVLVKSDAGNVTAMRAALDDVQKEIVRKGLESIKVGRAVITGGVARERKLTAWGHELRLADGVKPLPIKLT